MPDEINGNITNQDITGGVVNNEVEVNGSVTAEEGEITGSISTDEPNISGTVATEPQSNSLNATLNSETNSFGTTLSAHYGADGKPGKDGFSPTINVYEETEQTYILEITDVNGSYLTPNLKGSGSIVVGPYVEENLEKYPYINPLILSAPERDSTYLYIHRDDTGANRKVKMSDIALETEVADRFRTKIRTVDERPEEDWRIGDYIFLETGEGE